MEVMAEKEKIDRNLAVWTVYGFIHNVFDVYTTLEFYLRRRSGKCRNLLKSK